METVKVHSLGEKIQALITTRSHAFVADTPTMTGDNLGSNPYELLLASLGP